ncbi:GSCFA domain-containing protein [Rhizobium sp. XQZ8]|uniref:GSCFA domain-containing protein n=1 Tax=Rhizobium populisoli TaxID=2859785 RepID=UPI001C665E8C|nr:GSCFA domain-containing protein [Rhizobium populisoli]MBW6424606.1 GSCFA domain-containing protein [Rhizobium populisoli]
MKRHPYVDLPDYQFWKKSFGSSSIGGLDPVSSTRFTIGSEDKVVAAGSCFAQHVARHIQMRGFNFHQTEKAHSLFVRQKWNDAHGGTFNYDTFSARYGNIYTARQLRQLIDRAFGSFVPLSGAWQRHDGAFVDPFRPQVEPDGFISEREVGLDRDYHLAAVRRALTEADVFVFTMGLTEAWADKRDGAVYPIAPGVAGGTFDPEIHEFKNFTVSETIDDMTYSIGRIRSINPDVRILLTVSPVPLNATYEPRHVLQSTVYSKSVLRVAAQHLVDVDPLIDYFPSFEIITAPQNGGKYFGGDMRSVEEAGVQHVMDVFFAHYTRATSPIAETQVVAEKAAERQKEMERLSDVLCDEEAIDNV